MTTSEPATLRPMTRAWSVLLAISVTLSCIEPPPTTTVTVAPSGAPKASASVVVWDAKTIPELYQPGDVRGFAISQGEHRVGLSWGRYVGPVADGYRFETRIELEIPGRGQIRSEGELVVDEHGHVVHGFERSASAELRYHREGDALVLTDGNQVDEVLYEPESTPVAAMAHSAILHQELMFAVRTLVEGQQTWRLVSLSGGPTVDWEGEVRRSGDRLLIKTNLGEDIELEQGRLRSVEVTASELLVIATDDPWPTWSIEVTPLPTYQPPADATFTREEVELAGRVGEPRLFGEILRPNTDHGLMPAALYISSTGQEDRYGFAGPPPVDLGSHAITDALAQAGFIVLRFDERGRGKSEAGALSFLEQVEDARRAYRTLVVTEGVDPSRVVLIGHGEGGLRVLHVAAGRDVAGVALLAAPGRPYREVFLQQGRQALTSVPPELREQARVEQEAMIDAIEAGQPAPPELELQARWIREILAQKPTVLIAGVQAPLFLAQGGKDFEVDPQQDLERLVTAAHRAKRDVTVREYPTLDHRFVDEPETSMPRRYLEPGRVVDATFLHDLAEWAAHVTRAKTSPRPSKTHR